MEKALSNVIKWGAAVGGFIAGLYGGWTQSMRVLVIFMTADYLLGLLCALTGRSSKTESGHFLSEVAFLGLLRKGVIMVVVLMAVKLDEAVGARVGERMFQTAATWFYIASEGLSIVENAGLLGVPIPKFLRQALEALRDKGDGGGKGGGDGAQVFRDEDDEEEE